MAATATLGTSHMALLLSLCLTTISVVHGARPTPSNVLSKDRVLGSSLLARKVAFNAGFTKSFDEVAFMPRATPQFCTTFSGPEVVLANCYDYPDQVLSTIQVEGTGYFWISSSRSGSCWHIDESDTIVSQPCFFDTRQLFRVVEVYKAVYQIRAMDIACDVNQCETLCVRASSSEHKSKLNLGPCHYDDPSTLFIQDPLAYTMLDYQDDYDMIAQL